MFQASVTCTQKDTQHMAHWKSIKPPGYPHVHHSSPRPQPHKEFVAYPYFPHTSQILTQAPGPSHAVTSGHLFLFFNVKMPPSDLHRDGQVGMYVCVQRPADGMGHATTPDLTLWRQSISLNLRRAFSSRPVASKLRWSSVSLPHSAGRGCRLTRGHA